MMIQKDKIENILREVFRHGENNGIDDPHGQYESIENRIVLCAKEKIEAIIKQKDGDEVSLCKSCMCMTKNFCPNCGEVKIQ